MRAIFWAGLALISVSPSLAGCCCCGVPSAAPSRPRPDKPDNVPIVVEAPMAKAPEKVVQAPPVPPEKKSDAVIDDPITSPALLKAARKAKRRDEFKAGVETKNKTALEAHERTVARLKEEHQAAMEKYNADKAKYDAALPVYIRSKAEFDASKKLAVAVPPPGASPALLDVYRRKQKEVIEKYPETEAAADARRYLKNGTFPARKASMEPEALTPPREPAALKLPDQPLPIPLNYPPDPEEVAEAEALAKAVAANAEAALRAKDELDLSGDGLVLIKSSQKGTIGQFSGEITGTVINRTGRTLRYAQITFNLYDDSGAQVGTALSNINSLENGGRWNFSAFTNNRWATYRCTGLKGF